MAKETANRVLEQVETVEQGEDRPMPPMVQRWCELLSEEGFRPKVEQNDDLPHFWFIGFKKEGTKFGVYLDEKDPTYMQLELAYTLDTSVAPLSALLSVANEVNSDSKGVKATVSPAGDAAWFMLEWFSETPPTPEVLDRMLSATRHGAKVFFEKREANAVPEARA